MTQIGFGTITKFLVTIHWRAYRVSKWAGCFIGLLTLIVAVLLFSGQIVADLSTDSGAALNPYFALAVLSTALLLSVHMLLFLLLAVVSGISLLLAESRIS